MVQYLSPNGHDLGSSNYDGYGISLIVFIATYTILFFAGCAYLWHHRNHPIVKMRKIGVALLSILILHVYLFLCFMAYPLNGFYPCSVEFWTMSLYLPIGMGLFQAQNQQLLLISRGQDQLRSLEESYKPLPGQRAYRIGTPRYWTIRFKLWWNGASKQRKYESFVLVGMIFQVSWTQIVLVTVTDSQKVRWLFHHLQHLPKIQSLWACRPSINATVLSSRLGMVRHCARFLKLC